MIYRERLLATGLDSIELRSYLYLQSTFQ